MLERLIQISLKNKFLVLIFFAAVLVFGSYISSRMDVDVLPDLTAPTVAVITESHGYSAEEVEQLITFPVEMTLNGASHVRRIRSSSMRGISIVWVEFDWDTDIYRARQIVSEKLSIIQSQLPQGFSSPVLAPSTSVMGEIMLVGLSSESVSNQALREIADWQIRSRLLAVEGVAHVSVIGGEVKQYQIRVKSEKLGYYGISLTEVLKAIRPMNMNASGGFFNDFGQEYVVKGIGRSSSVSNLANILVESKGEYPVKLSDIADVEVGHSPKIGSASVDGKDSVILIIQKQPNSNTLALTERVDEVLADIMTDLPSTITMHTKLFRQADFIEVAIKNVAQALAEGAAFVVVILFLFLMNWRVTAISIITIPISLLVSIMTLKIMGLSINTMSLGGMAIAIGSLVDDAIIDVENVFKRVRQNATLPKPERETLLKVVFEASCEIRRSIWYSTLIIITAFSPLFFLSGIEGRLLRPLGIAFIFSLFSSTVVALSLTPVLCEVMLKRYSPESQKDSYVIRKLKLFYQSSLSFVLCTPKKVVLISVIIFFASVGLSTQLGQNFLPPFNEGALMINVTSLPGISLEESNKIGRRSEKILSELPEVKSVSRRTGRAELDEHALGVNDSELDVPFELGIRSKEEFLNDIRSRLSVIRGSSIAIGQPIGHRIDHMLSGTKSNIAIKLFGENLSQLFQLGKQIESIIMGIDGVVDVTLEQQIEIPQIHIKPKLDLLAKYNIRLNDFLEFIDIAFAGESVGQFIEEERRSDIVLKLQQPELNRIEAIRQTRIQTLKGESIPLYYVADVISTSGPHTINRENGQRKVVVAANVSGRDLVSTVDAIQLRIQNNVTIPTGVFIEFGGQFDSQKSASRLLLVTAIVAIFIIFFLLIQEFKSISLASIILLNLPLALIGGIIAVKITSGIVSIASLIGFITLFGIAVRNGMLLISRYDVESKGNEILDERIIAGSLDRLAPILMTALTTGLALLPLALRSDQAGNEIQSPMAVVILGGLLSSTVLNLFVIPVVYKLYKRREFSVKKSGFTLFVLCCFLFSGSNSEIQASDFETVLDIVARHHPVTQLVKGQHDVDIIKLQTGLNLKNPELSVGILKGNTSQSDWVLSQGFDFPTTYGFREKVSKSAIEESNRYLNFQYYELKKSLYLSLVELASLNKRIQYQEKRVDLANKMFLSSKFNYQKGTELLSEWNKSKTDLLRKQTQLKLYYQERNKKIAVLKLQGNIQEDDLFLSLVYPTVQPLIVANENDIDIERHPKVLYLKQMVVTSKEQVLLQKAENLPKFTVGYHRSLDDSYEYNGIQGSISMPFRENTNKVEHKEKLSELSALLVNVEKEQLEKTLLASYKQCIEIGDMKQSFKESLSKINDDTSLNNAYIIGQLSIRDYFFELDFYYDTVDDFLELEKQFFSNDWMAFRYSL